ncbi:competence/damage-inducible protein A [Natronococcus occultus]|uniref:Molybdenum cofactor synthesis domain protein n=1 Tax=Natronococcus occultus SP4 TaxID=694430 RepID=L0K236_9EURY|nr:molybdopterin-binding protein [Natronococcus occultus]AGB38620.1 molybdenum cofactor synthesis domain protein [Natronococcus occultus SP4]
MNVAIVTVGDELLAGTTTNTNAAWLAEQLTDRGATVERILTIPDDRELIAATVADWSEDFDAVIVTGGLGGTPDDVTIEAVAAGLGREMVVREEIYDSLTEKARRFREENPDLVAEYDLEIDLEDAASLPAGARPIVVEEAWAPGCVVGNVSVFAGIPEEMRAMFREVANEFAGDVDSRTLYTPAPEGSLTAVLEDVTDEFDVAVGSYPRGEDRPGRIRLAGGDPDVLEAATNWIDERIETVEAPAESTD